MTTMKFIHYLWGAMLAVSIVAIIFGAYWHVATALISFLMFLVCKDDEDEDTTN